MADDAATAATETVVAARWRLLERAGAGAAAEVWRAVDVQEEATDGTREEVAVKLAPDRALLLREARALGALERQWGPRALDAGTIEAGSVAGSPVAPIGGAYLVTSWVAGEALDVSAVPRSEREAVAAIIAHGVGRALAELHSAGVRHGDVKPSNIVMHGARPRVDRARDRGATLIDLGLSSAVGDAARGGTAYYASPELREDPQRAGPESDLYALGVVLRELVGTTSGEPARWADALLAPAPGGRPSATWVADRAARWLGLEADAADLAHARRALVRRTYLAVRAGEIARASGVTSDLTGPTREWVESAIAWRLRLAPGDEADGDALGPAGVLVRARWLAAIVGTVAASWPRDASVREDELASHMLDLAGHTDPSSWTPEDLAVGDSTSRSRATPAWSAGHGDERLARIAGELARPRPDAYALAAAEDDVAAGRAPHAIAMALARALLRRGESGRAWAALAWCEGPEAEALRAEVARRRVDAEASEIHARLALETAEEPTRSRAQATLARLAWDAGALDEAERRLEGARGAAVAEVRALIAYRRGNFDEPRRVVESALAAADDVEVSARLEAVRGLLEHARGDASASAHAFARAVEHAVQAGAVVEEATYLTGLAAAATDDGDLGRALESATRAALLWERLGRGGESARAWLSRAGALATIGASHAADEAADEAERRALASGDHRAAAYARWARVETRPPGDVRARVEAEAADEAVGTASPEDRARSGARLLIWAPDAIDENRVRETDAAAATLGAPARWEWWGGRAASFVAGLRVGGGEDIVRELLALVNVPCAIGSRGPALDAAARLANELHDGEASRRFEAARAAAAQRLRAGTPVPYVSGLASLSWARTSITGASEHALAPAQIAQLESIVRALGTRDRLKPLLEQVLDTMVLWSGVERGLLLLPAPNGRLVPRAARNLARRDLTGDQLVLSQSIARRAIALGDAVVATDAFAAFGDAHASVHALRLRSVLAVPLIARGETLGVVYLDDRTKKGAFGPHELAWVRLVASQAAVAIADARDQVLLKRAARRAERARAQLAQILLEREAELDATRVELQATREGGGTRYRYDAIAGRSLPMQAMLKLVDRVTASEVPVLLVGESGTGKELIARAVHANGSRQHRAFVTENCASVPESLLESALFGHVRGAFTGAHAARAGLFDIADGGTLFLDEIGEMPLSMQVKLLRVLQDGEVRAVGSERTRKVDVRMIGATHRDLEAMVEAGTFREDLFYRLNVITLRVPPLRERPDDIPLLVAHFLEKHAAKKGKLRVSRAAMDKLVAFAWPGNVRQLENEMRRAVVLADERIDVAELSADVARGNTAAARAAGLDLRSRVDALEADLVREALEKTNGNQTRAAEVLGLSRFGLQKMMKRLQIRPQ